MAEEVGRQLGGRQVLLEGVPSSVTRSLRYLAFDQLHEHHGVLKDARAADDVVVMVESEAMRLAANWHPERLYFYLSAARHFARRLEDRGFTVVLEKASSTLSGLRRIREAFPGVPLVAAAQSSRDQHRRLDGIVDEIIPPDFFLTPPDVFSAWVEGQRNPVMENFYRQQRVRLDVLMDGGQPVGGAWNFDKENRKVPPRNYVWPEPLSFGPDDLDQQVADELGHIPSGAWATTTEGARAQLAHFLTHHLARFGPYEDAMVTTSWSMHHSLLSPYLNNGLLHPAEVLEATLERFRAGDVPVASAEGFVRQIIGWREYVNGMYWHQGPDYRLHNGLGATSALLPVFDDASATRRACVSSIVADIDERAWTHHIPRLMVLSNLALLAGVRPGEFLAWMRRRFIDAAEWVMVPNVIGMGIHADNGAMMTKPYAAGGAYIDRMGPYCKECPYNPKLRTGETACPFTTLYWDFLARHEATFASNHRMARQLHGLRRLDNLPEVRRRAADVLDGLGAGTV